MFIISGADTHGTPIMLKAMDLKQDPKTMSAANAKLPSVIQQFLIDMDLFKH